MLYAVTLQVPKCKQVFDCRYPKGYKFYEDLTNDEQKEFITDNIDLWENAYIFKSMIFEQTPTCVKKRLHMHGAVECNYKMVLELKKVLIKHFGTPKYPVSKLIKIKEVYDWYGWHRYLNKQQLTDESPPSPPTSPIVPFMFNSTEHIISTKAL